MLSKINKGFKTPSCQRVFSRHPARFGYQYLEHLIIFCISYFFLMSSAYAAVPNIADMIENIAETVPELMFFVTAFGYVFGFWFVFHGLLLLKKYGMQRTQMSGEANLTAPLLNLFVGAALIYLPSSVKSGMATFWTDPNPYGYDTSSTDNWDMFIAACFMIIQLVGVIAFIRGLMMLTKLGQGGQQGGGFGKAMAHIIGGIFCIDMYDFLQAVFETLGLDSLLS